MGDWDPFTTVMASIKYRFFPVVMIIFMLMYILSDREFSQSMIDYEAKAMNNQGNEKKRLDHERYVHEHHGHPSADEENPMESTPEEDDQPLGPLDPKPETPLRWYNAVVPFGIMIIATFIAMVLSGFQALNALPEDERPNPTFLNALSHSNSVNALIQASALGWMVAYAMLLAQEIVTVPEGMEAWVQGIQDILEPTVVLLLAWALGAVVTDVQAAPYLANTVGDSLPSEILPAISALLCYVVSFATGSGFGTMAIMFPIIAPLSWKLSGGDADNLTHCFGSIMACSIFGNIFGPIGDTTVLTSLSVGINPLTIHVKTIAPHTILVALGAIIIGHLAVGMRWISAWLAFPLILAFLAIMLLAFGKKNINVAAAEVLSPKPDETSHLLGKDRNGRENEEQPSA